MFKINYDEYENTIIIYNSNTDNYIVFDLLKYRIIEFNNTIVDVFNEYFLSHLLYKLYIEFEKILNQIDSF